MRGVSCGACSKIPDMYEYVAAVPFEDVLRLRRPFPICVGHGLAGSRLVRTYDESWASSGAANTVAARSVTSISFPLFIMSKTAQETNRPPSHSARRPVHRRKVLLEVVTQRRLNAAWKQRPNQEGIARACKARIPFFQSLRL